MMRTSPIDVDKVITIDIAVGYPGGAAGSWWRGINRNGIGWILVKTGVGAYTYTFNTGLVILTVVPTGSGGVIAAPNITGQNIVDVVMVSHAGVQYDSQHLMVVTALDKRI
jgi:hypothetical protein